MRNLVVRIAIDFDNTIVSYGAAFAQTAVTMGFLAAAPPDKTAVRDLLRAMADGEERWMALQARVYGEAIAQAPAFPGLHAFLAAARRHGAQVAIVSHKSRYAAADRTGRHDLPAAARRWLASRDLIGPAAFDDADVYFEPTRAAKLARLTALAPTHVIDDLVEVFEESAFPAAAQRLLFAPPDANGPAPRPHGPWHVFGSWAAIQDALFPGA